MPSTFTTNTGIEKLADGEQSGLWGQTTNANFDIVDRALNGVLTIALGATTFTLTTSSGGSSDGQVAAVRFTGTVAGPVTVTVAPATAQKTYFIINSANHPLTITQGSGGDADVLVGTAAIVACDGAGAGARVYGVVEFGDAAALRAGTAGKAVDAAGVYEASAPAALAEGATITPDFQAGRNFTVTLAGNRTLANPTNQVAGQTGIIIVKQDATGSRTLGYGANWKFSNGAPTLTAAANSIDVIGYYVESAGLVLGSFSRNFS